MKRRHGVLLLLAAIATPLTLGASCNPPPPGPCAPPHASGTTVETIVSGGTTRTYRLTVPAGYTGESPVPVVLDFHGLGANAQQQAAISQLGPQAGARGMIVVTPQGLGAVPRWTIPPLPGPNDVAFVSALIEELTETLCVDSTRVYATGMSNGAGFASALPCALPGRFAAVGSVAGLAAPCPDAPPVTMVAFHGTADPINPYTGGTVFGIPLPPVETRIGQWASAQECDPNRIDEPVTANVTRLGYVECEDDRDVTLYRVTGGGHTWPGSPIDIPFGPTNREINATTIMLDAFAAA